MDVGCHAGYRGEEEPRWIRIGGERVEIEEILERWAEPGARFFRVRAADGNAYRLRHDDDGWEVRAARNRP